MAYRWKPDKSVHSNLRRLTTNQLRSAIEQLNDRGADRADAVHEARLHLKKARSLLRLARPAIEEGYAHENARLREVARQLSRQRDRQAVIEALEKLDDHAERQWGLSEEQRRVVRAVRERLSARQSATDGQAELDQLMPELTGALAGAADEVDRWAERVDDGDALMAGFAASYRRGRRALRRVLREATAENLHEWRKESKYHRYQVRLFQDAWPAALEARYEELKRLSDLLGDDHDLVVAVERVRADLATALGDTALDELRQLIERRREELQVEAIPLGRLLYAEKPKQITRRFQAYWSISCDSYE